MQIMQLMMMKMKVLTIMLILEHFKARVSELEAIIGSDVLKS